MAMGGSHEGPSPSSSFKGGLLWSLDIPEKRAFGIPKDGNEMKTPPEQLGGSGGSHVVQRSGGYVIMESDCASLVTSMNSHFSAINSSLGTVLSDCKLRMASIIDCHVQFIRYKGNSVAHDLARWALHVEDDKHWITEVPSFLMHILVLAQVLAKNNPDDPLINLLNPAHPTIPHQHQQPINSPVQSAASAKNASQLQFHIPPPPPNPPQPMASDVSKRLDNLERMMAKNRAAAPAQTSSTPESTPLNTNIVQEPYPSGFKMPQFETYDETKDPDDHLHAFYSVMQAQNASDTLICKIFPSTLHGNARTWYYSLKPNSISSYVEMATAFVTKFSSRRLIKKTTAKLMRVAQREGESLKNYINRFNDAVLEIDSFDQAVGIAAITQGLTHERFRNSLIKHLLLHLKKSIIDLAISSLRKNMCCHKSPQPSRTIAAHGERKGRTRRSSKPVRTEVHSQPRLTSLVRPPPIRSLPTSKDHTKYCDYHQGHGHTTKACHMLKSELESLAWKGMLNEFIPKKDHPRFIREQRPNSQGPQGASNKTRIDYQQPLPPLPTPAKIIHMINGGLEAGGTSSKQQKLYVSVATPHNDPLVTTAIINNCEIHRVLVDIGSALDIMYYHCFESLGLDPALLQKYDGPIYGFNNQPVPVEGVLKINMAFVGRPTLIEIRAIVSQAHLCMKFPTPMGIATLRGNQEVARHCYMTSVSRPRKDKELLQLLVQPEAPSTQQVMVVKLPNNRLDDKARAASVEKTEEVQIDDNDPNRKTQIRTRLKPEEREELISFLKANKDMFSWTSADMPGIPTSVVVHKLSTNPLKKPVAQERRLFVGDRLQAIGEETNLNDACPKDCHPMPNIGKLVEAASRNESLSLLDAYLGYHQVRMALEDEVKTSFYAEDEIYSEIDRNLEVYVDDIVVKSSRAEDHLTDLAETFNNLRRYSMKLNPKKCTFGVEPSKFLGFMVSRRGIEVNPEKIKAIEEMKPPRSTKDVQRLAGRVAALHKFISKSVDKCLPFFKVLRTAAQKDETEKPQKFNWTTECQAAFDELKAYLSSSPLLTKAQEGEILYLYLGISDTTVSSVLIAFQQRSAIRAQALADFVVECTSNQEGSNIEAKTWTLYVDGSFNSKGSGVGAVLTRPDSFRSEHALKFNFEATNNVAEYEALLLGLCLVAELKVKRLQIYSDSQLVVNQINSMCEVIDPTLAKYVTAVSELKNHFKKFQLTKISRAENEHVDSLSKLASENSGEVKFVYIEILNEPSFQTSRVMEINTDPEAPGWTDPIKAYLLKGTVLGDKQEEMKLRKKASQYTLVGDVCTRDPIHYLSSVIYRYGIPNQVIADNGPQFNCNSFKDFCSNYGIKLVFTSVYHPEANGMVESVNKAILEGIKPRLDQLKTKWLDELNNVLWAYRATSRTATGESPYHLAFGTETVITVEIGVPSLRTLAYKQRIASLYDKRIRPRNFRVGDLVLRKAELTRFETRYGKLALNWEGHYLVTEISHPSAYILQDAEGKKMPRVWNVNNLKKFHP
ncbi:hypothetical protein SLEP1_g15077 [Rubroshorea leprosula]|uniref:Uncharacterized protein n=1 Tax=Rubroshorea leprosula TaxID=152421 RepID=A0AAV5IX14_9ROSI|nr:hypothetical protein SLEP1_g15077 [Rubroshorea leprosula]